MTRVKDLNSRLSKLESKIYADHGLPEDQVNKIVCVASEEDLKKLKNLKNDTKGLNEQLKYFFLNTN